MKKTLLSVVLCVAVLLSTVSAMLVMPASAASSDLLAAPMAPNEEGAATFEYANGTLTVTANKAGAEVGITPETALSIKDQPYIDLEIEATADWDMVFYDKDNNKWMYACADFCNIFGEGLAAGDAKIPAGTYKVRIDLSGAYTWTGDPVPDNADMDFASIIARQPGTIKVTKLVHSDGMADVSLNSASYVAGTTWDSVAGMLSTNAADWGSVDSGEGDTLSSAQISAENGAISVSTTNDGWPAATYDYATPIKVDWATAAIEASYSIYHASRITLFYNNSTNANFDSNEYVDLSPAGTDPEAPDLTAGRYSGVIMLKDIIPESAVAEDGTVTLNGIKVFAVGTGKCVTVDALNLLYNKADNANNNIDTGIDVTTPTVAPNGNNGGNGGTTTNPGTGDTSNAIVFVVVAAVAAGVVTLSVVSKKAKAN